VHHLLRFFAYFSVTRSKYTNSARWSIVAVGGQVIQEAVYMTKMRLAVPRDAQLLLYAKPKLRRQHSQLVQVLRENADIRTKIDDFSQPLFSTSLKKVRPARCRRQLLLFFTPGSIDARG